MPDTTTTTRQLDTALAAATKSLPEVKDALVPYNEASGDEPLSSTQQLLQSFASRQTRH